MDVIQKAKELGEGIKETKELDSLKKCEQEVQSDSKAKLLLNDYRLLQAELIKATKQNKKPEIIENIKRLMADKQKELNSYDITKKYIEARDEFNKLMKTINDVIIFTITGETKCSSDDCSTCGGCK